MSDLDMGLNRLDDLTKVRGQEKKRFQLNFWKEAVSCRYIQLGEVGNDDPNLPIKIMKQIQNIV